MKLTGKAKEDFEKWYKENYPTRHSKHKINYKVWVGESWDVPSYFWWLPKPMQWGVLVDFFDSVGITLSVNFREDYWISLNDKDTLTYFKTRAEARIAALEKANEIYNN